MKFDPFRKSQAGTFAIKFNTKKMMTRIFQTLTIVLIGFVTVANAQNVGVGNTAPAEKLHVTGNLRTDGIFVLDGRITPLSATSNIYWGHSIGGFNTTASNNVAIGNYAFADGTTGMHNVAIGGSALNNITTGSNNVAIGYESLLTPTTTSGNTAMGASSMKSATTGINNVSVGVFSLTSMTTGNQNAAFGQGAGQYNVTGSTNTFIGAQSGFTAKGSGHVFIGYDAGAYAAGDNLLYISNNKTNDPLIYGEFDNGLVQINGTLSPRKDNANTLGSSTNRWSTVYATNGTIQTSDERFKKNIENMGYGLTTLMQLRPVTYQWKEEENGETKLGFIAQELEKVVPEVVSIANDDIQTRGVNYAELVPVLVKAIQEQQQIIDGLQGENASLKDQVANNSQELANIKSLLTNTAQR